MSSVSTKAFRIATLLIQYADRVTNSSCDKDVAYSNMVQFAKTYSTNFTNLTVDDYELLGFKACQISTGTIYIIPTILYDIINKNTRIHSKYETTENSLYLRDITKAQCATGEFGIMRSSLAANIVRGDNR